MALHLGRSYCCYDTETTSRNAHGCQLTQISAIMIDSYTLKLIPGGVFDIEIKPEFDDKKAIAAGYDPVEPEALRVTKKTREQLEKAVEPKIAWNLFVDFVNRYNPKGTPYFAPIPVGFNINGYDTHIIQRYANRYGPKDDAGKQKLLHPIYKVDVMDLLYSWFEDHDEVKKANLQYFLDYFGFPAATKDTAHNSLYDVMNTGNLFIMMMKHQRQLCAKTKFAKAAETKKLELTYAEVMEYLPANDVLKYLPGEALESLANESGAPF